MPSPPHTSKTGGAVPRLDSNLCGELEKVVSDLTHSGQVRLDDKLMKQVKTICRISDVYVEHAFNLLTNQLAEEHSEIRLSSFQIMNELFNRSHRFRELLVADMQVFLEYTVGTDKELPLPPPRPAAELLKRQTLKAIQEWNAKYGKTYKKLALGYGFLQYNKMVDFANLEAQSEAERRAQEARRNRMQLQLTQKINIAIQEMQETIPEINECLTQLENCFDLLIPDPARCSESATPAEPMEAAPDCARADGQTGCSIRDEGGESADMSEVDLSHGKSDVLQQHGLSSRHFSLDISLNVGNVVLQDDVDNHDILVTVDDMYNLAKSAYLPKLKKWMEVLSKSGKHEEQIKRCMDMKQALKLAVAKRASLEVQAGTLTRCHGDSPHDDGDSDSEEFEEVPEKEGYEPFIPEHLREEYGLEPLPSTSREPANKPVRSGSVCPGKSTSASGPRTTPWHPLREAEHVVADPASQAGTLLVMKERLRTIRESLPIAKTVPAAGPRTPADEERLRLLAKAPVVPYGVDIEHWADPEKIEAPTIVLADTSQRIWCSSVHDEVKTLENAKESLTTRVFSFTGEFQPVKWACRTPTPTGTLCQRMDRVKCPFHGTIIPRDDQGKPTGADYNMTESQKEQANAFLADSELQRDIEAGLGMDPGAASLSGGKGQGARKGKGKAPKYPNLTDLKKKSNTTIKRLEKRVLNKQSLKRVATAINKLENKRFHDKFGNNFNYR